MKFKKILFAFMSVLLGFIFCTNVGHTAVSAEETQVTFTLHKLLFENGDVPTEIQNDGLSNPFLTDQYEGLNDVTFAVYDVSDAYYTLRAAGKTMAEAQDVLASQGSAAGSKLDERITTTVDGEKGIVGFTLQGKDNKNRDAVYSFIETAAPENIVAEKATPLVAVLPIYDTSDHALREVALYPKNEQLAYTTPKLEKEISADKTDVELGETIPFTITTEIPVDVWEYTNYTVEDNAESPLSMVADSLKVTIDGQAVNEAITAQDISEHGFSLAFDPQVLNNYVGKEIKVTYAMIFNQVTKNSTIENDVTVTPGNHPKLHHEVQVKTGSKQFVKVDTADKTKKLAGAKFVVKNAAGEYLQRSTTADSWVTVSQVADNYQKENLFTLTSAADGSFAIYDLAYGTYQLEEVEAPDGYVLSDTTVAFKVNATSSEKEAAALDVVNQVKPTRPHAGVPPTGFLPQTGEAIKNNLHWIGLALISGVLLFVLYKRNKNKDAKN
ncbi:SpaH/EbpB family LPXTG-anchored major pilin [Enterococcus nangangensis]|uniref:SpaH/EbpB family LPXTG-anchored major pilin n=1 Tax=Enterococcus nangangensis TaxID=2559926 RepID=UPI0010F56083|nr:SpaH/EbpB family LPXTG-anchored major pilin [Enterococcus nangangensis]